MKFKGWKPQNAHRIVRFYLVGEKGVFIGRKKKLLQVSAEEDGVAQRVYEELKALHIDLDSVRSVSDLEVRLRTANLLIEELKKAPNGINHSSPVEIGKPHHHYSYSYLVQHQRSIDMKTIKLKEVTKNNVSITFDHLLPIEFKNLLKDVGIHVKYEPINCGDIQIVNNLDPTKVILIRRKPISEGLMNKQDPAEHAHAQAEIYQRKKLEYARNGISLQIIWIFEADSTNGNTQHLFNMLPTLNQTSNFIQFLSTSCNQQVIESLGMFHTAYFLAKIAQGLCEQELYYPVNVLPQSSYTEKEVFVESFSEEQKHYAIVQAKDDLAALLINMPGINKKIAKELAYTGKSLAQITALTQAELEQVDGIGPKSAAVIHRLFNLCS